MILLNPTHFETICIDTLRSELLRISMDYLLVFISKEVGHALSPSLSHFQSLKVS